VLNGFLFAILAGAMITVSASSVKILFGISAETTWYPTDLRFIFIVIAVGAVVVGVSAKGFRSVAGFSQLCAPWMIIMFCCGAIATYPLLQAKTDLDNASFIDVASLFIWRGTASDVSLWHVAGFAWICNLAMHGGLSDMSLLRFAKHPSCGFFSALGMFLGHYLAWICAGVMGAAAAIITQLSISNLDSGIVAYETLGITGIAVVIIAGWTTSNPTIYRAGLAFQSLCPKWNPRTVTILTGIITTAIACFPFVFTRLMEFVGIMGLLLAPIGAIIVTEHWLLPRLQMTRYWSWYKNDYLNLPAFIAWIASLFSAFCLHLLGVHLYFLFLPTWLSATVIYLILSQQMGAKKSYAAAKIFEDNERSRKHNEKIYLAKNMTYVGFEWHKKHLILILIALSSLIACLIMALYVNEQKHFVFFKQWLWIPSLAYFISIGLLLASKWEHN
jgi:NCS1 family nucleobase:cation symporter-1